MLIQCSLLKLIMKQGIKQGTRRFTPISFKAQNSHQFYDWLNVNTICLPKFDGHFSDLTCSSMGWGVNSEDVDKNAEANVNIMKQVKLNRVTDREQCLADIQTTDKVSNTWTLDESWICAKKASDAEINDDDINLCRGDGGGPLVCQEKGTDRY